MIKLIEARKIRKGEDAIELLKSGKLAGMVGGKKFIPQWVLEDPDYFKELVDSTLTLLGDGQNIATDETIKYLMKCSFQNPSIWEEAIVKAPDTLINLSLAFLSKWISEPAWAKLLDDLASKEKYDQNAWHSLEKELQDKIEAVKVRRGRKIKTDDNDLYSTLYDDGTWKLCVPKSYAGDVELASHIKAFDGGKHKTRWCTAASPSYYNSYSKGGNKYYIIQYWEDGEYTEAWQIAFCGPSRIEFMDKRDNPNYKDMLEVAPSEMLSLIICDHPEATLQGISLFELKKYMDQMGPWNRIDMEKISDCPWLICPEDYIMDDQGLIIRKKDLTLVSINADKIKSQIIIPKDLKAVGKLYRDPLDSVTEMIFEEGMEIIPCDIGTHMQNLESVIIPSTVKKIDDGAFYKCRNLKSISIPSSVKIIGEAAFARSGLVNVQLEEGLEEIGEVAFRRCNDLEAIELPRTVTYVEDNAFAACPSLREVKIPGLETIEWGEEVFSEDHAIENPEIKDWFEID